MTTQDAIDKIKNHLRRLNAGGTDDGRGIDVTDIGYPDGPIQLSDAGGSCCAGTAAEILARLESVELAAGDDGFEAAWAALDGLPDQLPEE